MPLRAFILVIISSHTNGEDNTMTLIKSISGIRGTIGGQTGDTLNPLDIVKFVTAYATFIRRNGKTTAAVIPHQIQRRQIHLYVQQA